MEKLSYQNPDAGYMHVVDLYLGYCGRDLNLTSEKVSVVSCRLEIKHSRDSCCAIICKSGFPVVSLQLYTYMRNNKGSLNSHL